MGICNFTLALLSLSLTAPVPASKGEPLPPGALLRLGTTRFRHANQTHTAISSDGQQVITFSTQTKSVKVWDLTTGKIIRDLSFSTKGNVYGFAWSPGGETFATLDSVPNEQGKYDLLLHFHDVKTGLTSHTETIPPAQIGKSSPLKYFSDGRHLAILLQDSLSIRETKSGAEQAKIPFESERFIGFDISEDGQRIALFNSTNIQIWNGKENSKLHSWVIPTILRLNHAIFSPNGKRLALTDEFGGPVVLVETVNGKVLREFQHPIYQRQFRSAAFSPDEKYLYVNDGIRMNPTVGDNRGALLAFDLETGALAKESLAQVGVSELVKSKDGESLISLSPGYPRWDMATGTRTNADHEIDYINIENVYAGRNRILTLCPGQRPRLWDAETGQILQTLDHKKGWHAAAFSPDGRVVATGGGDDRIKVWEADTGKLIYSLPGHSNENGLKKLAFTSDGKSLISFGTDFFLRTTDLKTGKATREFAIRPQDIPIPNDSIDDIQKPPTRVRMLLRPTDLETAMDQSGKRMSLKYRDNHYLIDTDNGKITKTIAVPHVASFPQLSALNGTHFYTLNPGEPISIVLPSGMRRMESSKTLVLRSWDTTTGEMTWEKKVSPLLFARMAFSPDGAWIAITEAGEGSRIDISFFATANGNRVGRLKDIPLNVFDMTYSTDGKRLILALIDYTALVYLVPTLDRVPTP